MCFLSGTKRIVLRHPKILKFYIRRFLARRAESRNQSPTLNYFIARIAGRSESNIGTTNTVVE